MDKEKNDIVEQKLDNLTDGIENNLKGDENKLDDSIDIDKEINLLKKQSKKEKLKHKLNITNNIYNFLSSLTIMPVLSIILIIILFIIYPFSYIKIPFIDNNEINSFINLYFKTILESLKIFGTFIIGVIITDWASSKYKDDD